MTRPKPWQAGHAPSGELNPNMGGVGSRNSRPQPGQCRPRRKDARALAPIAGFERARQGERHLRRRGDLGTRRLAHHEAPDHDRQAPVRVEQGRHVLPDLDRLTLGRDRAEEARAAKLREARGFARRPLALLPAGGRGRDVPPGHRRDERRARSVFGGPQLLDRALHTARDGADAAVGTGGRPPVREEEPQRVVDLRLRADRRARVADAVLLLERDGRRHGLDRVRVGAVETLEELPGVGREGLRVAPLAFGVERVEGEAGLARARNAGDHGHPADRDVDGDVPEVVGPRAPDADDRRGARFRGSLQTGEITIDFTACRS